MRFHRFACGLNVVGFDIKVDQTRHPGNDRLQRIIVDIKPVLGQRIDGPFGVRVDRNNFKSGQRLHSRCDFEATIVGAVLWMLPSGLWG